MKQYYQGQTAVLGLECRLTTTNALATPSTSYSVYVWDSQAASKADNQTLTVDSTGKMHYALSVASDANPGEWEGYFKVVSGSYTDYLKFQFEVLVL